MLKPKRREREEVFEHPFRDLTNRFAVDALIRELGYVIFRRKTGKPTLWKKRNRIYSQDEVLSRLDPDKLWNAEYVEKLYFDGLPSHFELSMEG